jgi:hypothetical protein
MFSLARSMRAGALLVGVLVAAMGALAASPTSAFAYGQPNWEITFHNTTNFPSTGQSFGFWGWCALRGGVTSGNDGDCQVEQYTHAPAGGGFNCHESLNLTAWTGTTGTFVITGSATVNPVSETANCLALFPGSANFTGIDTGFPAAPGHYDIGVPPGAVGNFSIQVNQVGPNS